MSQLAALALPRREQEALASANAFATLGGDRHQIRWQLAARQQSLPLFEQPDEVDFRPETALPEVTEVDALLADYACTGLTLGRHPLALLREQGLLGKCHSAASLWQCRHGQNVTVAGWWSAGKGLAPPVVLPSSPSKMKPVMLIWWYGVIRPGPNDRLI